MSGRSDRSHDRAPYDLKIDHIDADGLTLTIYTTEPCPAIINYLGDPYGAIIDMDYGIQGEGGSANIAGTGPYVATNVTPTQIDLVKNEDYWGGDVKVDNIISKILCRWKCSDRSIADRGYPGNLWIAV